VEGERTGGSGEKTKKCPLFGERAETGEDRGGIGPGNGRRCWQSGCPKTRWHVNRKALERTIRNDPKSENFALRSCNCRDCHEERVTAKNPELAQTRPGLAILDRHSGLKMGLVVWNRPRFSISNVMKLQRIFRERSLWIVSG
jgi:hypothetical protein